MSKRVRRKIVFCLTCLIFRIDEKEFIMYILLNVLIDVCYQKKPSKGEMVGIQVIYLPECTGKAT